MHCFNNVLSKFNWLLFAFRQVTQIMLSFLSCTFDTPVLPWAVKKNLFHSFVFMFLFLIIFFLLKENFAATVTSLSYRILSFQQTRELIPSLVWRRPHLATWLDREDLDCPIHSRLTPIPSVGKSENWCQIINCFWDFYAWE